MPYCLYETCCRCADLKTGCVIFAIINLVCFTLGTATMLGERQETTNDGRWKDDRHKIAPEVDIFFMFMAIVVLLPLMIVANIVFFRGIKENPREFVRWILVIFTTLLCAGAYFPLQELNVIEIFDFFVHYIFYT